jgi:hypothetical protein
MGFSKQNDLSSIENDSTVKCDTKKVCTIKRLLAVIQQAFRPMQRHLEAALYSGKQQKQMGTKAANVSPAIAQRPPQNERAG